MKLRIFTSAAIAAVLSTSSVLADAPAKTGAQDQNPKPTIVLVHGAFADGSSWSHIIPILERDGYPVIAVQNPLTSLPDDIATTKRVIDAQKGPVVLVGHSYGGAVITGAGVDEANVKALVYIAAFAPEAGEPLGAFTEKYPAPLLKAFVPDSAGFLSVDRTKFHALFCADVPAGEAQIMSAVQKPVSSAVFGQSVPIAAWKTIPSWYIVAQNDMAINPDLERFYAQRIGAHTSEVKSSHVPFISRPKDVAAVIEQAAKSAQ
ncbi:MAG: hypothetical protein JWQ02_3010 [Capsulimonas sp.]|jgi:pimeloyl-ACP methyl ester carboxylesterase|nr:hypothetical protein [Capsulimonas sp.]